MSPLIPTVLLVLLSGPALGQSATSKSNFGPEGYPAPTCLERTEPPARLMHFTAKTLARHNEQMENHAVLEQLRMECVQTYLMKAQVDQDYINSQITAVQSKKPNLQSGRGGNLEDGYPSVESVCGPIDAGQSAGSYGGCGTNYVATAHRDLKVIEDFVAGLE